MGSPLADTGREGCFFQGSPAGTLIISLPVRQQFPQLRLGINDRYYLPPPPIAPPARSSQGIPALPMIRGGVRSMSFIKGREPGQVVPDSRFPGAIITWGTLCKGSHLFSVAVTADHTTDSFTTSPSRRGASCYSSSRTKGLRLFPPPRGLKGCAIRGFPSQRRTKRISTMSSVHCALLVLSNLATSRMASP